jgi:hypothetical protein
MKHDIGLEGAIRREHLRGGALVTGGSFLVHVIFLFSVIFYYPTDLLDLVCRYVIIPIFFCTSRRWWPGGWMDVIDDGHTNYLPGFVINLSIY